MSEIIYGRWSVLETLRAKRRNPQQLILAEGVEEKGTLAELLKVAGTFNLVVKRMPRRMIDDMAHGANHQGVALRVSDYPYAELDAIFQAAEMRQEKPLILLLDLLQDPQNVGTLMRIADSVGVHGVILQDRRGVGITPAVVNASSGAVEHLNVVQVTNLVATMKQLQERDVWLAGLDMAPDAQVLNQADLNIALGLVLGSEGEGLRRLVKDTCDMMLTLPMRGHVDSLNVATVGAVALYTAWGARGYSGWRHALNVD